MPSHPTAADRFRLLLLLAVRADQGVCMSFVGGNGTRSASPAEEAAARWRVRHLGRAQRDVYRLLQFGTEHGDAIDEPLVRQAVDIVRIPAFEITEDQEQALWRIRGSLSEKLRPAHASGLRLMERLEAQTGRLEPKTVQGWSGRWLLFALVSIAIVHAYAVVGGRLIDDATQKTFDVGQLSAMLDGGADDTGFGPPAVAAAEARKKAAPAASSTATGPGTEDVGALIEKSRRTLRDHQARLQAWNNVWRLGVFRYGTATAEASGPSGPPPTSSPPFAGDATAGGGISQARAAFRAVIEPALGSLEGERYVADVAHTTMMTYLLPMLYGALGAFIFIVRLVGADLDRGSLRALLRIRYRIRLLLGAVFGLTVAMLTIERTPFMNSVPLSAVALSFFAGYGVDGVFGLLDAVIGRARRMGLAQLGTDVRASRSPSPSGAPAG